MSDNRFDIGVRSAHERLERLSQRAGDLPPPHRALMQEVLEASSASVEELQMAAEERERLLERIQRDQEVLGELAKSLDREREIQQRIMQHTAAHLAYLDPEFNFLRVNATYARGSGYRTEDLIGRNHFELFPDAENQAIFERVRDTGEPIQFHAKPFEFPDQPERGITYWDWTLVPTRDEDEELQGLVLSLLDVTETVKAEQALRNERDRAQSYLNIAGVIIVAIRSDQTVTLINRKGCEILGYEEEEIVGKNWFDSFIPERERERVRSAFGMVVAGELAATEQFENLVLTSSGEERLVAWHNTLLRDEMGAILGTLSSGEDVTESRWAERRFETVLRMARDGFWIVDHEGWIQDVNDSLAQMLGYSIDELLAMAVSNLEAVETAGEVSQHIDKILEQGHDRFESQLRRKDGEIIDIEASASCLATNNSRVFFTFIRDATERKRSERALQKLAQDLGERVKELNCLHSMSDLVETPGISLEEIVEGTVGLLPAAWRYPEVTCARITLEGQEFSTENFAHSPWQQTADILARGEQSGTVQVGYLQERPASDEGPFLKEEKNLIDTIARRLGEITERMRAQQQLVQQHQFVQGVLDSLPHPFYVINTQDRMLEMANSAAFAGRSHGKHTCFALVHGHNQPCDALEEACPLQEVLRTKRPVLVEHVHIDKQGRHRDVEVRGFPITDSEGNVVQMIEYTLDITERKEAEQALRESEERLRALFEILPVGISVLDESREIQFANPALARILRLSQEQLRSGEYEERIYLRADGTEMPPDEFPSNRAFREQRLVRDVEICVVLEDGERVWTTVSAVPLLSANWRVIITTIDITDQKGAEAALRQARDELEQRVEERTSELAKLNKSLRAEISERRRAEEELRASEERFRQLAENTEDIILLMEPDSGRLLYVSPAYEKLLGQPARKVPERIEDLWADVHPDDLQLIPRERVDEWIGQGIEFRITARGGKLRWIRARAFPVRDETGQIYRLVGIASDITEQKQSYAALIEAEQLAIAGRMAASLGHEINNPLQAAIGCLDLSLEQLDQGKDPNQHLQVTADALERASRVVAQLRALHYPMDAERKEESDLNRLLENILILVQKQCRDQHVEVDWQAAPDLPPVLLMPDAIQQVCLNLVLNALEAMPQGGRLQISTSQSQYPAGILIRLSDSGDGIPADAIERVFEPFFSTKPNSLGLGLFISHNIVQEHGGQIEVHSREGEGTTFSTWLPLLSQGGD